MGINFLTRAMAALRIRPSDPQQGGLLRFFGANNAGSFVTHEVAEKVAAVWACIDAIASSISSSDWNVYRGIRGESNKEARPSDDLQYILNTRMNPEMTAQAGKRAMMISAVGRGTGYAEIERDLNGNIINLWPIRPDRVEPRRDLDTGRLFYRVTQEYSGGWVEVDPADLFIIRGASLVGFAGDDMIGRAIQTIATAVAIDQFSAAYFGNGTQLGGMLEFPGKMNEETFERIRSQWNQKYQGPKNAFKVGILENGLKYSPLASDAEKAQLVDVKNLSVEEICRWFRVPPHKVAHLLRSTNNNIEHQGLEFSRDTLRPWVKEIEQESDYKLFSYRTKKFVEIDVDWAEQGDYKSRMEAYGIGIANAVFSPNDVLRKLGENTIGKAGDIRFVNGAAIPLDRIGDAYQVSKPHIANPNPDQKETLTAWLTSVYARIQRRMENREADLERAKHRDWKSMARSSTIPYAEQQIAEMEVALGEKAGAAKEWAMEVINGCDPRIAAMAVMQEK